VCVNFANTNSLELGRLLLGCLLLSREVFQCYGRICCCGNFEADRLQAGLVPSLVGYKLRRCKVRKPDRTLSRRRQRVREVVDVAIRNVGGMPCRRISVSGKR
jgi:hypothetical protein